MWWNNYISIPFAEKGRSIKGCDCWGLVRIIYKNELGINLNSYDDEYINTADKDTVNAAIEMERGRWISVESPREFDVVVMNMKGLPMHVGIVTRDGFMLHCAKGVNTSHERYNGIKWKSKIVGFERHSSLCGTTSI